MKLVFFLTILSCIYLYNEATTSDPTLKLVQVFLRHGSRTPELKDVYPNDPYKFETFQPWGWGQLTNIGKKSVYELGKLLRKRYDSFLGDIYTPEIVLATSTDFDRTKMSLLLTLAALFKPSPSQVWDEELPWQPIPIHYEKHEKDTTLKRPDTYCPAYFKELEEVLSSDEAHSFLKEHKPTLDYISNHTGKKIADFKDLLSVYQTLNAEDNMNLTLPEWTKSVYPKEIQLLAAKRCEFENYNTILKKLNGGRMLGKVIENMVAKSSGNLSPDSRKLFLYSGHENNVINILAALNLFEAHVPKYSAAVIIELHYLEATKEYAVKVYYSRDVKAQEPEGLQLQDCDVMCPLNKFIQITRSNVPVNYTAECHSNVSLD